MDVSCTVRLKSLKIFSAHMPVIVVCIGGKSGVIRWGIVSAGLIATDFCLALRTLSADEHQVDIQQHLFFFSNMTPVQNIKSKLHEFCADNSSFS